MKLLIVTQAVDRSDTYLGFFSSWIAALSKHFDGTTVIALTVGEHALSHDVHVHSLGKERGSSRIQYAIRFMVYIWKYRSEYDVVFVHMNQEYVLLGGLLWRLLGKRIYLWRNHYAGSWMTDVAAYVSNTVFFTSVFSYTAKFRNAVQMPVGIDTDLYLHSQGVVRTPDSVLFYARLSPSKRPDIFLEALGKLRARGIAFSASIFGTPLPEDEPYARSLRVRASELGLAEIVRFNPGLAHSEGPRVFGAHDIFVNLGASGMYDKMIFEAAASGCIVLAASGDYAMHMPRFAIAQVDAEGVADQIERTLGLSEGERETARTELIALAKLNGLESLATDIARKIKSAK